jgi:hypothetical protein
VGSRWARLSVPLNSDWVQVLSLELLRLAILDSHTKQLYRSFEGLPNDLSSL